MFRHAISISLLVSAATINSVYAHETYFSPAIDSSSAAGSPWTFTGSAEVQRGFTLPCDVDIVLTGSDSSPDDHGSLSHTDISDITGAYFYFSGSDMCSLIGATANSSAGPVTYDPSTHIISFANTKISTITLGYCAGTLSGILDPDAHTISITGTLPGYDLLNNPSLPNCSFSGSAIHSDSTHTGTDEINETGAGHSHIHTH